jgi:hypothetical protein
MANILGRASGNILNEATELKADLQAQALLLASRLRRALELEEDGEYVFQFDFKLDEDGEVYGVALYEANYDEGHDDEEDEDEE